MRNLPLPETMNPNLFASDAVAIITPDSEVQDIDTLADWTAAEMKFRKVKG